MKTNSTWYAVNALPASDEAEVMIYDVIGGFGIGADKFVRDLKAVKAKTIHARLNTPGGSVAEATAIHNAFREHPARIVMHIDGVAASAGSFVAMAGDEVRMADNAYLMIHNAHGGIMGYAGDMRKTADMLDKMSESIAGMYAKKTKKPVEYWLALMDEETWFTATEAKAEGLCDVVTGEEKMPQPMRAEFDFTAYNKIPDAVCKMWGIQSSSKTQAPPRGVPVDRVITQETKPMTKDTFLAYAAENPDAVASYVDQGKKAGIAEGRQQLLDGLKANLTAADGDYKLAIDGLLAGHGPEAVKFAADNRKAEAEARIAAEAKAKQAEAQAEFVADGAKPIALPKAEAKADDKFAGLEGKELIEAQWAANHEGCKDMFKVYNAYLGYRLSIASKPALPEAQKPADPK